MKRGFLAEIPEIVVSSSDPEFTQQRGIVANKHTEEPEYWDIDYEDINDIARGEGFLIDEDGHWMPLDDQPGYDEY